MNPSGISSLFGFTYLLLLYHCIIYSLYMQTKYPNCQSHYT